MATTNSKLQNISIGEYIRRLIRRDDEGNNLEKRLSSILESRLIPNQVSETSNTTLQIKSIDDRTFIGGILSCFLLMEHVPAKINWTRGAIEEFALRIEHGRLTPKQTAEIPPIAKASKNFCEALRLRFYRPDQSFIRRYWGFTFSFRSVIPTETEKINFSKFAECDPDFRDQILTTLIVWQLCIFEEARYYDDYGNITVRSLYDRVGRPYK